VKKAATEEGRSSFEVVYSKIKQKFEILKFANRSFSSSNSVNKKRVDYTKHLIWSQPSKLLEVCRHLCLIAESLDEHGEFQPNKDKVKEY